MDPHISPIEEIQAVLKELRQTGSGRRRFPQELWNAIIDLTKIFSVEEICEDLGTKSR